jgi:hypothetical protein
MMLQKILRKLPIVSRSRLTLIFSFTAFLLAVFTLTELVSAAPLYWTHSMITVSDRIGIRTETPDANTLIEAIRSGFDAYIKSRSDDKGAYFQTQSGINWAGYNMLDSSGNTATYFGYRGSTEFLIHDLLAGENRVQLSAAGTSNGNIYLNPDNYGKVGIQTTSPSEELTVQGGFPQIQMQTSSASQQYTIGVGGGGISMDDPNTFAEPFFIPYGAPSATMVSDTSGLVGIGTWSPDAGLEVARDDSSGFELRLAESGSTASDHSKMVFDVSGTSNDWVVGVNSGTGVFFISKGADAIDINTDNTVEINYLGSATTTHLCRQGDGTVSACSSAAEYVPTIDTGEGYPEAGELVSLLPDVVNPYSDDHATFVAAKSAVACDTNLVGWLFMVTSRLKLQWKVVL